jgi:DNA-binding MarR family transcriptional regulator
MTKQLKAKNTEFTNNAATSSKHQQVIDMLSRDDGASLKELSAVTNWLPHSTRAFLNGLKKKGYTICNEKSAGVRRYRTVSSPANGQTK